MSILAAPSSTASRRAGRRNPRQPGERTYRHHSQPGRAIQVSSLKAAEHYDAWPRAKAEGENIRRRRSGRHRQSAGSSQSKICRLITGRQRQPGKPRWRFRNKLFTSSQVRRPADLVSNWFPPLQTNAARKSIRFGESLTRTSTRPSARSTRPGSQHRRQRAAKGLTPLPTARCARPWSWSPGK